MFLALFLLCSTLSFAQQQKKENIFAGISINNSVNHKDKKSVNPATDVSTIAIINTSHSSNRLAHDVLVRLKGDDNILYHIIDMNAKTNQEILDANKYFVLANLGYSVPQLKGKCWSIIRLKGVDYIALFIKM